MPLKFCLSLCLRMLNKLAQSHLQDAETTVIVHGHADTHPVYTPHTFYSTGHSLDIPTEIFSRKINLCDKSLQRITAPNIHSGHFPHEKLTVSRKIPPNKSFQTFPQRIPTPRYSLQIFLP